jgi:hypothetical protein
MSEQAEKKKDEVLKLFNEVDARAASLEGLGQSIVQSARFSRDVVKPMGDLISQLPADSLTSEQLEHQMNPLRAWQAGANEIELSLTSVKSFQAQSLAAASTSNTTIISIVTGTVVPLTRSIKVAISELNEAMERRPLADDAVVPPSPRT